MSSLYGIPIIINSLAEHVSRIQIRFPRSKRKRIKKKWKKQEKNFRIDHKPAIYKTPAGFICHPIIYQQLQEQLKKEEEKKYAQF